MLKQFAFAALSLISSIAFAGGSDTHEVVAYIARYRLTPQARAGIADLLEPRMSISDPDVANWADHVKHGDGSDLNFYHFIHADVGESSIDLAKDGKNGKNVVDGIAHFAAILANPSAKKEDRQQALRWVVNLVADVHQPVHCCERNGDSGQAIAVLFERKKTPTNLYTIWNTDLLHSYIGRGSLTAYAADLANRIKPEDAAKWAAGTPLDWANESHAIAVKMYATLPPVTPAEPPAIPAVELDAGYANDQQPIIETQMERGGVRLAMVLNNAFAVAATQPTSRPSTRPTTRTSSHTTTHPAK